ncbi:MAG: chloride channel protein, partial [Alistipes sp.]|nr:chloride channel protein [Alistipes sp.]
PEAPIVLTGAAIGSNVAQLARLNYKHTTLLLCCGAGAALAAIFKAPITGVIFVLEILMLDITATSIIPLLIATVTATTIAFILRGFDPIIAVTLRPEDAFELWQIPLFILLGVGCGLMAWYFTSMNSKVGAFFKKQPTQYRKWIIGGAVLGILIFIFPPLYGEGYNAFVGLMHGQTDQLFNNSLFYRFSHIDWVIILFVVATMFFKVIAMATTNAAGGVGGTFAPSLFVGAFTGAALALICNALFGWQVPIASFTLVGMAGVMAGVMNAPLTSIFLIAELSNGYGLFIPLMITACISFAVNYYLDPDSIYTKQLRQKGELLTHDKDQSVFVFLKLDELMETDFVRIREQMTLGDLIHIISTARRNIFPVIDNFGRLLGVVQVDDLRRDMFKREKWGAPVSNYMIQPPDRILQHESIQSILPKFEDKNTWMLPVVDKDNHYLGFISKSRILNAYRQQLVKIQQ